MVTTQTFTWTHPTSLIIAINCFENPHRGVSRSPFMKIITEDLFINDFKRSSRLSFEVWLVVFANFLQVSVNFATSIPSIRSIAVLLRKNMTVGTASTYWTFYDFILNSMHHTKMSTQTWCFKEISLNSSAGTFKKEISFISGIFDSSAITSKICLHCSAQSAENRTTVTALDLQWETLMLLVEVEVI